MKRQWLRPLAVRRVASRGGIILIFRQVEKTVQPVSSAGAPNEVLTSLRRAVESGSFVISEAVLAGLRDRGLSHGDVRNALGNAVAAEPDVSEVGRWTVRGPSMDGEEIAMSVAIESGVVMVI